MSIGYQRLIALIFALPVFAFDAFVFSASQSSNGAGLIPQVMFLWVLSLPIYYAAFRLWFKSNGTWVRRVSIVMLLLHILLFGSIIFTPADVLCSDAVDMERCAASANHIPWPLMVSFLAYAISYQFMRQKKTPAL